MRVFRLIQKLEEWMLATGILAIAALTILNVFTRTALGSSLAFAEELSQFFIIFVTFIGLSYGASQGRHIRMTALYDQLGQQRQRAAMVGIAAFTSALLFALVYYSLRYVATVKALGTVSPALQVPLYLVYLSAPLGLLLGAVQYAMTAWRNLRDRDHVWIAYDKRDEYDAPAEEL